MSDEDEVVYEIEGHTCQGASPVASNVASRRKRICNERICNELMYVVRDCTKESSVGVARGVPRGRNEMKKTHV